MQENKNTLSTPVAILIGAIIVAAGLYFGLQSSSSTAPTMTKELSTKDISRAIKIKPNNDQNLETKISQDDHIKGDFNQAEVFVIEYSDLECPFCKRFHDTEYKAALEKYNNNPKVAFVFRHFPLGKPLTGRDLHPTSVEESVMAECVAILGGNDKFFEIQNAIFEETSSDGQYDLPYILEQAEKIGIKKDDLTKCYEGTEAASKVAKQFQQGVLMGVQGTPTIIIQNKAGEVSLLDRQKGENLLDKIESYLK